MFRNVFQTQQIKKNLMNNKKIQKTVQGKPSLTRNTFLFPS